MALTQLLKDATQDAHRAAEQGALQRALVQGTLGGEALFAYLGQLQLVHEALESQLDAHPTVAALLAWPGDYRHSTRLQRDRAALGAPAEPRHAVATPACERWLRAFTSAVAREPLALLGVFYVLEGSMNGNHFIVRKLRAGASGARCAFLYFDPYGDAQPARWAAVKKQLDAAPAPVGGEQCVLDAALQMFRAIGEIAEDVLRVAASASSPSPPASPSPAGSHSQTL